MGNQQGLPQAPSSAPGCFHEEELASGVGEAQGQHAQPILCSMAANRFGAEEFLIQHPLLDSGSWHEKTMSLMAPWAVSEWPSGVGMLPESLT